MPSVSAIIPTFNRQELLRRALNSIQAQTFRDSPQKQGQSLEIIVIDDGSQDGTREMIEKEFPAARYFYQENQGPSAARNLGIREARGEWIAFLDSDDEWMPGKLAAQMEFFAAHPEIKIAQTEEIWIRNGKRVNPMNKHRKRGGFIFEECLPLCIISPSAVMIHKTLFQEVGLFDESLPACEDYDLWLRIAARHAVGLIDVPYVVKYGGHADQRSHEFPAMDRFRIQALAKILKSGALGPAQEKAARAMLEEKSRIYIQGALKRGKEDEAQSTRVILRSVATKDLLLNKADSSLRSE